MQTVRGLDTSRNLLSCTDDGKLVELWTGDDGSGRQKWKIVPINDSSSNNTYLIEVYDGVSSGRKYLSSSVDGTIVNLWAQDDGSGRQEWVIPNLKSR